MSVFAFRTCLTLALAVPAAFAWSWLRWPLPWMLGPMVAVAVVSMLGGPTRAWLPLRDAGQWVIATALGLYFTPQVSKLVAGLWWAVVLAVAWAFLIGWVMSLVLMRMQGAHLGVPPRQQRATCYFASTVGGAAEMTVMAERVGGRADLVAAAHSLRLLIVSMVIPFSFTWFGVHGGDPALAGVRHVHLPGLALLLASTLAAAWALRKTPIGNPWFMGPLVVSTAYMLSGVELSAVPQPLTNAAQLAIGVSLGVRFQGGFLRTAPRWLGAAALSTLCAMAATAVFAWLLARGTGLSAATLILGTSPGGIAEMSITAKVLQLGVPVVIAFQMCRLFAVMLLATPVFHWLDRQWAREREGEGKERDGGISG